MTPPVLRAMTLADLPFCLRLSSVAGWNQTAHDWRRALALEPHGAWIAALDERDVGTVTTCRFQTVGWIALLLVAPAARRRGVGRALFERAVEYLEECGATSQRLDATPLGQPLYEEFHFSADFTVARFAGSPRATLPEAAESPSLEPVKPADLPDILELDARITQTRRTRLLERLYAQAPDSARLVRGRDAQTLDAFGFARPGRMAAQIGPCLAASPTSGERLLRDALRRFVGQFVYVDIPVDHHAACEIARRAGLEVQRTLVRMSRGLRIHESRGQLWSSSGPEKG